MAIDISKHGMRSMTLSMGGTVLEIRYPQNFHDGISGFFLPGAGGKKAKATIRVAVQEDADGTFSIKRFGADRNRAILLDRLPAGDVPLAVIRFAFRCLPEICNSAAVFAAGAVCRDGASLIVAGETATGKTGLIAWLMGRGFKYLADQLVLVESPNCSVGGTPFGLIFRPGGDELAAALDSTPDSRIIRAGDGSLLVRPSPELVGAASPCRLVVFPHYSPGRSELKIEAASASQTGFELMRRLLNSRSIPGGGMKVVSEMARNLPTLVLHYGDFAQLDGIGDTLIAFILHQNLTSDAVARFIPAAAADARPVAAPVLEAVKQVEYPIPEPTARLAPVRLTIGMATYDDYDGVFFSLQAIRMFHPEILNHVELLVVDNHPNGPCAQPLKDLEGWVPNYRYVPELQRIGTSQSRNLVFEEAAGEFVLCMDCHVLIVPGALRRLLDYFTWNPGSSDLLQGPLIGDDLAVMGTHFDDDWSGGMWGKWGHDTRGDDAENPPFEIPMQGLGLFACRKEAWLGFNSRFRGFGGEEGYIHEKYRQHGARTLCLPFLRWLHRFSRPMGLPYPAPWEDRIRNYVIGHHELGLPMARLEQHFSEMLGENFTLPLIRRVREELEPGLIATA